MNFKYIVASCFALLGVVSSVPGFSSSTPLESSDSTSVGVSDSNSANENSTAVCSNTIDSFTQDDAGILASEYSTTATADCLFVGCGGVI